jgi:hypothetical protein
MEMPSKKGHFKFEANSWQCCVSLSLSMLLQLNLLSHLLIIRDLQCDFRVFILWKTFSVLPTELEADFRFFFCAKSPFSCFLVPFYAYPPIVYFSYNSPEAQTNTSSQTSTPTAKKTSIPIASSSKQETTSVSSSYDSQGSISSGEYTAILDYLANVEDPDALNLGAFVKGLGTGAEYGMDMDATDSWVLASEDRDKKLKRAKNRKETPLNVLSTSKDTTKTTPKDISKDKQPSSSPSGRFGPSTPHSRQGSAFSTPTSWGRKDKKLRVRPSPLALKALKQRYDLPFIAAIDPISKLVDDDALIVMPHDKAMAAAFGSTHHEHNAIEIIIPVLSPDIASSSSGNDMELDNPQQINAIIGVQSRAEPIGSSEEASEEDFYDDEEEEDTESDGSESISHEEGAGEDDDDDDDEEEEDGESIGSDMDENESSDDYLQYVGSLEESPIQDDTDSDSDTDSDMDSTDSADMSSDAGSEDGGIEAPSKSRSRGEKDPRNATSSMPIGRNTNQQRAMVEGGIQMKHDMRRRTRVNSRYSRNQPETGEFASQKKQSKAERKKEKKRNRDDLSLELHELQTWNGLVRDFILRAPIGIAMPFSPMGRFQRKQLHWLSEFYGLRSQSFGSGSRRTTSVFVTRRTQVPELPLSLAACKAIFEGNHPFAVSSAELELTAIEIEKATPKRRTPQRETGRAAKRAQKATVKTRSPLLRGSRNSNKDSSRTPSSSKSGRRQQQQPQDRRRSRMDVDEENSHHGLEFSGKSTVKRLVGADAALIPESNLGHAMLRKLGWESGGLGKEQQGIADPIQAVMKSGRGGLGS